MKIALTTDSFIDGQGGVATAVAALARHLRRRDHEVMVYTAADPSHTYSDINVSGLRTLRYERFPGGRVPIAPISLAQELANFRPDIIHNHSMGAMGVQALAVAHLLGIPILGTCHVFLAGFLKYAPISLQGVPFTEDIAWRYTTAFFNRFHQITTPSDFMRQELIEHGLHSNVVTVSNGVDTDLFKPLSQRKRKKQGAFTLLHIGRLGYEKRVDQVLLAFSLLDPDFLAARLRIVGDGPEMPNLQQLAKDLGISDRVVFDSFVPHANLPEIYQQADVFITASSVETQGLVVLEAMACGLPVIGVNALALPELIHPNVNGFLVPVTDEGALARATDRLLSSADLRQKMGKASRHIALEHNLPSIARAYEKLYQQVIPHAPQPLLSRIPQTLDPAVVWSSFNAEVQEIKDAGVERFWEVNNVFRQWAGNAFHTISNRIQNDRFR